MWVLVGLFFYLNAYTRRRYFTLWSVAWMFYALWLTLCLGLTELGPNPFLTMLKQASVGTAATFMLWGASSFLKQPTPERLFGLFFGFLVSGATSSAYHSEGGLCDPVPVFALMGPTSGLTALWILHFPTAAPLRRSYLAHRRFCPLGRISGLLPVLGIVPELMTSGFFLSAVLQLFIAVSMIVLVLEEARDEQRTSPAPDSRA